jgi:hypothetical protein
MFMGADSSRGSGLALALALALSLAAVATWRSPAYVTDRETYEQIGREIVVPDCSNLHCTRVLAAWVIEQLPGESIVKWKTYAVLGNMLAAWGIAALCRRAGLSRDAVYAAAAMSALGPGAQLTAFDPHTSDPLIYAVVPWLVLLLADGRFGVVTLSAAILVWAKEFAAAPLWIFAIYGALLRRTDMALKSAAGAALVTAVWITLQLWFILGYNYSYGGNSSARILEGGYLLTWIREIGPLQAAGAMTLHFGPLVALAAAGWRHSATSLRLLAASSAPAALAFAYVQQPDRAIWNFQFVLLPLAAAMFQGVPLWLRATWLASFAVSNLPIDGGWATGVTWTGFAICTASSFLVVRAAKEDDRSRNQWSLVGGAAGSLRGPWWAAAATTALLAVGMIAAGDVALHRRSEMTDGFNLWGYRGPVVPHTDRRVVVLGGRYMLGQQFSTSPPRELQELLNNPRLRGDWEFTSPDHITVVNLAERYDATLSMRQAVDDAGYLGADVVCLYIGAELPSSDRREQREGWRRQSWVYRTTGYLPALPSLFVRGYWPLPDAPSGTVGEANAYWQEDDEALAAAVVAARPHSAVLVATHPALPPEEVARQNRAGARLRERFGSDPGFEYLDLRQVVDLSSPMVDAKIAESLAQGVFRLLRAR